MEDDAIHVVEPDGPGDDSELSDLLDRWKIPVAAALGFLVFVVFVVSARSGASVPPGILPEASPVLITTQPTSTTTSIPATTTSQMTTTRWLGAGTLLVHTKALCRAINPSVRTSDEWVAGVFVVDLFGVKVGLGSFGIDSEVARVRNDQDIQLVAILDPILADLQHALDSVDAAFVALGDEAPDRWQHQVDLAERYCARAITTLESIVSTLYAEQLPTTRP